MFLRCASGGIEAEIGMTFSANGASWSIVSFDKSDRIYSPSDVGGTAIVKAECMGEVPPALHQYAKDGRVEFCGDSVCAALLAARDGKSRSARGDLLTTGATD